MNRRLPKTNVAAAVALALTSASYPIAATPPGRAFRSAGSRAAAGPARETLETLRARFRGENEAVKRAKFFPKFGAALLEEMKKEGDAGRFQEAFAILREYRDAVRMTLDALEATGRDAEKHPAGFLQLEVHLRQSLRQVGDIVRSFPYAERELFQPVQKDLDQIAERLVKELFPRGPEPKNGPPAAGAKKPGPGS
jgi:hypothetical protein